MQKTSDAQERSIAVIASPNVYKPTAALSIEAAEKLRDRSFITGVNQGIIISLVYQHRIYLLGLIENVMTAILVCENMPQGRQGVALQSVFNKRDNTAMHERLRDACYNLKAATDDIQHNYPQIPSEQYVEHEADNWLIQLGNDYGGGLRRLVESETPSADELRNILIKYGSENIRRMMDRIRANAPQIGRESGIDEVTRAIGDYALDKVPDWGKKWTLIGKRHFAYLDSLEKPNEAQRRTLEKYRSGSWLDRTGERHWQDKFFLETVRYAYAAVGGK